MPFLGSNTYILRMHGKYHSKFVPLRLMSLLLGESYLYRCAHVLHIITVFTLLRSLCLRLVAPSAVTTRTCVRVDDTTCHCLLFYGRCRVRHCSICYVCEGTIVHNHIRKASPFCCILDGNLELG